MGPLNRIMTCRKRKKEEKERFACSRYVDVGVQCMGNERIL